MLFNVRVLSDVFSRVKVFGSAVDNNVVPIRLCAFEVSIFVSSCDVRGGSAIFYDVIAKAVESIKGQIEAPRVIANVLHTVDKVISLHVACGLDSAVSRRVVVPLARCDKVVVGQYNRIGEWEDSFVSIK